ncbi:hypothetical protein [Naumannella cuiyingiana]|uniref:Putative membrane protein YeaQ/YmgE (Transglycosylase-associated protein family) n=1 Tax=Naumannella cuiyingiana TaxID=1347891 RepID=A0A7Z0IK02_9ACTN|nr:hypothetical protein [Naumannella cuiyingiana]NYI69993.1 putative membrane protein YeaQ/YmgE (transglycosylase-associated protein family) [Naumannella cuiyingiana]
MSLLVPLLQLTGALLTVLGIAHVALPRVLGWTDATTFGQSPLGGLVIRMHVGFIGGFVALLGLCTLVGAPELAAGGRLAALFLGASALLWLGRAVCEVVLVPRALAAQPAPKRLWRTAHLLGLLGWPGLVIVYGVAAWQAATR